MQPEGYFERGLFCYTSCCLLCAKLQVADKGRRNIYTIERDGCSPICCAKWNVMRGSENRGAIEVSGCCCYPDVDININDEN